MDKNHSQVGANKILVAYASRGGSTSGVAEAIGSTLAEHGLEVEVRPMQAVHDLTPYRAVVAGSAIRIDQWLPEARQFMQRHQQELTQKPFAAFLVCLALATKNARQRERAEQTAATWLQPVRNLVHPVSEGLFAGVLDISKLPEVRYRLAFRLVLATGLWSEGDYRDWDAIRRWANTLPAKLLA
ncbi:MAG: flavodoxin domain-containing protein [Anaerolineae bacterium]|nr:flavodoxin domain-containing protein [Anaerolineae bacterium]